MRVGTVLFPVLLFIGLEAYAETYRRNLPGGIMVTVVDGSFRPSEHHIENCDHPDTCLVDHLPPLMTVGLPTTEIKSINISVGGTTYRLPASRMYDPGLSLQYGGLERFAGFCTNRFNCVFRAQFAEGGGAFSAEWIIRDGVAERTVLSTSIDISMLFSDNPIPRHDQKSVSSGRPASERPACRRVCSDRHSGPIGICECLDLRRSGLQNDGDQQ